MKIASGVLLLMLWINPVWSDDSAQRKAIEEAQQAMEPKVTIHTDKRGLVEEYRLNGALYMLKITPKHGLPYYLVDADGDGELESRRNELDPDVMIPSWMIFRW